MKIKSTSWRNLPREQRIFARMERIATCNTIYGGASAITISKRLLAMGGTDLTGVVSAVYSASTGRINPEFGAFECPECGCAHLGQDAAFSCCSEFGQD